MDRANTEPRRTAIRGRCAGCLALALAMLGCGGVRYVEVGGVQAYYRTGYPLHDASPALERIFASVMRIHVSVAYDSYLFAEDAAPTLAELAEGGLPGGAVDMLAVTRTRAATAVAIASRGGRVTLLTAHHAVQYPDTLYEYFPDRDRGTRPAELRRLRSVSVKTRQANWVISSRGIREFEILAQDEPMDLALIGFLDSSPEGPRDVRTLTVRAGDAARLTWGSFVYVLGYPAGYAMATRGIVSIQPEPGRRAFVVDGLWNEGMSGGIILGVRGESSELEWLGMVRAAAAEVEPRLVPPEEALDVQGFGLPYEGPVLLEESLRIRYGIMLPVSITEIRRFVDRHRTDVRRRGYDLPRL